MNVHVQDVFSRCCVSDKDAGEVVTVQFGTAVISAFDTHARAEHLQKAEIRLVAVPELKWCVFCLAMDSGSDSMKIRQF